jgi:hypothetical protein
MRERWSVLVVAAMVTSAACSSSGTGGGGIGGGGVGSGTASARIDRDVIAEAEITNRAADAANALQVIQKLRPQMLRTRGLASPMDKTGETVQPRVYVDNIEYGNLSTLTNVNASQIREIRYINSRDATTTWGTGHMGGVILILTKK